MPKGIWIRIHRDIGTYFGWALRFLHMQQNQQQMRIKPTTVPTPTPTRAPAERPEEPLMSGIDVPMVLFIHDHSELLKFDGKGGFCAKFGLLGSCTVLSYP